MSPIMLHHKNAFLIAPNFVSYRGVRFKSAARSRARSICLLCSVSSTGTAFAESFRLRTLLNLRDVYSILRCFALNWIFKLDDMSINLIEHTGQNGQKFLVRDVIRPQSEHARRGYPGHPSRISTACPPTPVSWFGLNWSW